MYQIILSAHIAIINTFQWYVDENSLAGYLAFLFGSIAVYSAISRVQKKSSEKEIIRLNLTKEIFCNISLIIYVIDDCNRAIDIDSKLASAYKCRAIARADFYIENKDTITDNLTEYFNDIIHDYQLAIEYYSFNSLDRDLCMSNIEDIKMMIKLNTEKAK